MPMSAFKPILGAMFLAAVAGAQSPHSLPADLADPGMPVLIPRTGWFNPIVFGEGVVSDLEGNVYFNEMENANQTLRLKVGEDTAKPWRTAVDNPNGMWLDAQNRIFVCQQRAIVRVPGGGEFYNQVDTIYKYDGQDFNDITGDSKGNLFFTNYAGSTLFFRNFEKNKSQAVFSDLDKPNGVEWDEARKRLYLHELGSGKVLLYDVADDYSLSNRRDFADVEACDGITLDERGDVYSVSFSASVVHVFDPDGKKLGEIPIPGQRLTNLAFGGVDFKTLYMITERGLYKLPMKVKGYRSGQTSISIAMPFRTRGAIRAIPRGATAEASEAFFRLDGRQAMTRAPFQGWESGASIFPARAAR